MKLLLIIFVATSCAGFYGINVGKILLNQPVEVAIANFGNPNGGKGWENGLEVWVFYEDLLSTQEKLTRISKALKDEGSSKSIRMSTGLDIAGVFVPNPQQKKILKVYIEKRKIVGYKLFCPSKTW